MRKSEEKGKERKAEEKRGKRGETSERKWEFRGEEDTGKPVICRFSANKKTHTKGQWERKTKIEFQILLFDSFLKFFQHLEDKIPELLMLRMRPSMGRPGNSFEILTIPKVHTTSWSG